MKQLICLISTVGKSPEQIGKETLEAFQKYLRVKKQVEEDMRVKAEKKLLKSKISDLIKRAKVWLGICK